MEWIDNKYIIEMKKKVEGTEKYNITSIYSPIYHNGLLTGFKYSPSKVHDTFFIYIDNAGRERVTRFTLEDVKKIRSVLLESPSEYQSLNSLRQVVSDVTLPTMKKILASMFFSNVFDEFL